MRRSDRLVQRSGQRGEELRAGCGHMPAILEPHTELARYVDSRLVREAHARRERRRVVAHQIGTLVDVHADTVPGPMRQTGQRVVLAPALALVETAHRLVNA